MFTVRRGVNFHFFRFEVVLTPKIAWQVACDVGVGCLFWKGKKIHGTFKEEEKYRGELMIMVSAVHSLCAESSAGLLAGGGRSALRYLCISRSVGMYVLCSLP